MIIKRGSLVGAQDVVTILFWPLCIRLWQR